MIAEILYDSFVYEKCNLQYGLKKRGKKYFLSHVKLWNMVLPCLVRKNSDLINITLNQVNEYIAENAIVEGSRINEADFECFYNNETASYILFILLCQINIELSNTKLNFERLNMLIRSSHNLPRCMIKGDMFVSEQLCIEYSFLNMSDDVKRIVKPLINHI